MYLSFAHFAHLRAKKEDFFYNLKRNLYGRFGLDLQALSSAPHYTSTEKERFLESRKVSGCANSPEVRFYKTSSIILR